MNHCLRVSTQDTFCRVELLRANTTCNVFLRWSLELREVDPNGVLLFREDKERISYHNKKWYLQGNATLCTSLPVLAMLTLKSFLLARYKGTSWMVANNKIKHSIRDMLSHFEHKEIRFKPHPNIDTSDPVWKKLQNRKLIQYQWLLFYGVMIKLIFFFTFLDPVSDDSLLWSTDELRRNEWSWKMQAFL